MRVQLPFSRHIGSVIEQGVAAAPTDSLRKRIRLTNALSLFGAFVMLASIPFDWVAAPAWIVAEDALGGIAYLLFPLLNRAGRLTTSRLLCVGLANLIVL